MNERRIEYVRIADLKPATRNPKDHDIGEISLSMDRFGYVEPVVMDERTGQLVAGHGRIETLTKIHRGDAKAEPPPGVKADADGTWLVPVVRGWASKDDREAEAYLLASNRLTEIGGWNDTALAEMLGDLAQAGVSFQGIGYDERDLEALLKAQQPPEVGQTPEERLVSFQAGEIKQIVLYFDGAEYDSVMARLARLRDRFEVDNNTEVFHRLMDIADADPTAGIPPEEAGGEDVDDEAA
jgi:hypothetical protein